MTPRFDLVNIAMVYLLAVVVVALRESLGAAILTALLSVGLFDYWFVPPQGGEHQTQSITIRSGSFAARSDSATPSTSSRSRSWSRSRS